MSTTEGYLIGADGHRLYYTLVGTGPQTLILPSATFLNADLAPLADTCRLLFYDARGRGRSDAVANAEQIGLAHDVRDLEAVRAYFGLETCLLFGWSYLAAVTLLYAAAYPAQVARLLLAGPLPPRRLYQGQKAEEADARVDPTGIARLAELRAAGLPERDPAAYCREHRRVYLPRQLGNRAAVDRMNADPCACPNEWVDTILPYFAALFEGLGDWDLRDAARPATMPILVLHGTEDTIPMAAAEEWVETLPNARLHPLSGVGHFPWVEDPGAFFPAARAFLASSGNAG